MQTRRLSTRWAETGYASALAAFVVSAFFFVDAFGEYFVNTSYFFSVDLWIETSVAIVAAAAGVLVAGLTYLKRR